jgi:hypothetical protein
VAPPICPLTPDPCGRPRMGRPGIIFSQAEARGSCAGAVGSDRMATDTLPAVLAPQPIALSSKVSFSSPPARSPIQRNLLVVAQLIPPPGVDCTGHATRTGRAHPVVRADTQPSRVTGEPTCDQLPVQIHGPRR